MSQSADRERFQTWIAFLRAHAALIQILGRDMQEKHDIPLMWFDVLVHLKKHDGTRLQDLAEAVVLSRSGLTRLLDRMEEAGLVERKPCLSDRRGAYALLTEAGGDLLEEVLPTHLAGVEAHFLSHLCDEEVEVVQRALSRVWHAERGVG